VELSTNGNKIKYEPGDHIAIYPQNNSKLVNDLIGCLNTTVDPDEPIFVESRRPSHGHETWLEEKRMPVPVSVREALTYYLDIANPPSPQFLKLLAKQASRSTEQEELNELAKGGEKYEDWKYEKFPSMVDMLNQFHSLKVDVTLLLQQLPLLQCVSV
jgi:sulfite reductase alpha subunit-like flavoprotein